MSAKLIRSHCSRLCLLLVSFCLAFLIYPVGTEAAPLTQATTIQINLNTARVRYRDGVSFQIIAHNGTQPITKAQLKVRFGKRGKESSYDVPVTDGTATYLIADETESLTTGMPLIYYWIVGDDKTLLQTTAQTVVYDDTRQNWREREGDHLTVRWYSGDDKYGQLMYQLGTDTLATYKRRFNIDPQQQIYITIYGSSSAYHTAFPEAPQWSGGLTRYGGVEIIVIAPQNLNASVFIGEGIPHELSHASVYQFMGGNAPRWLDEGFAVYNQNTIDIQDYDTILQDAYKTNSLIPLSSLDSKWPADEDAARLAYAEGRSIVTFMINTYHDEGWRNLLDQLRRHTIDDAMKECFGVNLAQMEDLWKSKTLGHEKGVTMPIALKLGQVPSQPTEADLQAKYASRFPGAVKPRDDGPEWLVWLLSLGFVAAFAGLVSFLLVRRYRRMNALDLEVMPRRRAQQEEAYLKSRLGATYTPPAQNQPPTVTFPGNVSGSPSVYTPPPSAFNPASLPTPLTAPAPSYWSPSSPTATQPIWNPAPVAPNPTATAPADDPFDLIVSSFRPPAPAPSTPSPRLTSSPPYLNLDPYGLGFEALPPTEDKK